MANWANIRLVVVGRRADVLSFGEAARRRQEYFTDEMRVGEGGELKSDRASRVRASALWEKVYRFQTSHDDEKAHFRRLSRLHPGLWFLIAYSDPNADDTGGHLIQNGRTRSFSMTNSAKEECYRKAGHDPDAGDDENEMRFWDAQWMMLDACIDRWRREIPGRKSNREHLTPRGRRQARATFRRRLGP